MAWAVEVVDEFAAEYRGFHADVQDELVACVGLLENYGPTLGRPHCDTLKESRYPNMKELRFAAAGGAWRVAFAFDPRRSAILLVGGDKSGSKESRFYRRLIALADRRYAAHLRALKGQ